MIGDSAGKGEFRGKEMVDGATLSPWNFGEVSVVMEGMYNQCQKEKKETVA